MLTLQVTSQNLHEARNRRALIDCHAVALLDEIASPGSLSLILSWHVYLGHLRLEVGGGRSFFQATNQPTLFSTQFFATSLKSSQNSCKRHRHPGIRWDFLKFLQDSVNFWTNQMQTLAESEFQ